MRLLTAIASKCVPASLAASCLVVSSLAASQSSGGDVGGAKAVEVVNVTAGLDLDAYGGTKTIRGQATGWFSIQQIAGRSWLITPEGHGFISLGVVHLGQISQQPIFATAYGSDESAWVRDVAENLRRWGFNSLGYGGPTRAPSAGAGGEPSMPVVVSLEDLLGISRFSPKPEWIDLFSEESRQLLARRIARRVEPVKAAKHLIGYYYVDLPLWRQAKKRAEGWDWAIAYRRLGADAPGKARYVDFLLERHRTVAEVNRLYGVAAAGREELVAEIAWAGTKLDDPVVQCDDRAFVRVVADRYYRMAHEELRKLDPHHLIFGDRYAGVDLQDLDDVLQAAAPYVDGIAIQPFESGGYDAALYDRVARLTGRPIMFADFAVNFSTSEWPKGLWKTLATEEAASEAWRDWLEAAFSQPYTLGVHRCTYIDRPRGAALKQGLVRQDGTPYVRTVQRMAEIHRALYERMYDLP